MKKKFRVALLVSLCVMMLAGVQSAFATVGVYDGPATAKVVKHGDVVTGYITAANDSDWYVITESGVGNRPKLLCPTTSNLNVQVIWMRPNGTFDSFVVNDAGAGGLEDVGGYINGPGQLMYLRIFPNSSSDISSTNAYTLVIQ